MFVTGRIINTYFHFSRFTSLQFYKKKYFSWYLANKNMTFIICYVRCVEDPNTGIRQALKGWKSPLLGVHGEAKDAPTGGKTIFIQNTKSKLFTGSLHCNSVCPRPKGKRIKLYQIISSNLNLTYLRWVYFSFVPFVK